MSGAMSTNSKDAVAGPAGPSRSPPPVASTIASAGKHNQYIWQKAGYFFGADSVRELGRPGEAEAAELVAAGAGVPPPSKLWLYARAGLATVFIIQVSLALVNFVMLPLQLLALAGVAIGVARQQKAGGGAQAHGMLSRWNPWSLRLCELLTGWWQLMVSGVLEHGYGMRVVLSGDLITDAQRGEGALVISNHPSTADWCYLFSWFPRMGQLSRLKIVLKGSMHDLPIIGWALQCARYLFLARNWERDQVHMQHVVQHWAACGTGLDTLASNLTGMGSSGAAAASGAAAPVQVLMFPEGTDLRPVSFDQSAAFTAKCAREGTNPSLTPFQHVLQPRTTGFVHLVRLLRASGSVKAVYDLTLGSTPLPVTIENLARGVAPEEFHVHCRRFELADLPQSDVELGQWLQARWAKKDEKLERFYTNPPWPRSRGFAPRTDVHDALSAKMARPMLLAHFSAFFTFGVMFLLHAYALYQAHTLMTLLHAALIAVWITITKRYGGFDSIMIKVDQAYAHEREEEARAHDTKKDK